MTPVNKAYDYDYEELNNWVNGTRNMLIVEVGDKRGRISLNSPSVAYLRRWTGSALVQILACRLDGAKPLSEPMLTYWQLDRKEHISMKFYL